MSAKRLISDKFHLLKPKKNSQISFPIFVFNSVDELDTASMTSVVVSLKFNTIFFIYDEDNFSFVPLSKYSLIFFARKRVTNVVIYNCDIDDIENQDGKILPLLYQEKEK